MEVYRLALFASDIGWHDLLSMVRDRRIIGLCDDLFRALGSIHANVAEGYSRGTSRDRARFYEYALGSARESRSWYYQAQHVLGERVASHRMSLLTQIIRLLLAMVPQQRGYLVRKESPTYQVSPKNVNLQATGAQTELGELLQNVPIA